MRVAFTSDLHIDHQPRIGQLLAARVAELSPDVLVVAGDLSHELERVQETLQALAARAPTLYVPGNHELWAPDSRARYLDELPEMCARAGATYLPSGPVAIGGVVFVGQTGWFDYSLRVPALDGEISLEQYRRKRFGALLWTDGVRMHWPGLDDEGLSAWMAERLARDLERAPAGPRVVVTHHLPFPELVFVRGHLPWDYLNAFMGSVALGQAILGDRDVVRTISGHTHTRRRAVVGGRILAEVSPVGYPREYGGAERLPARVVQRLSTFVI